MVSHPETVSGPVLQLLWLFSYDQGRLSLTPAAISSHGSACTLCYFITFLLSFFFQFLESRYMNPKHVISNILKVAGILHHF